MNNNNDNEKETNLLEVKHNKSTNVIFPHGDEIEYEKETKRKRFKSDIHEDSDEDEDALRKVVSSKGQYTSFLQVRNISK